MSFLFISGKTVDDMLKWPKTDPGWGWYIASNIVQWMLVIDYSAYFLTFYIDFKRIQLEIPTVVVTKLHEYFISYYYSSGSYRNQ